MLSANNYVEMANNFQALKSSLPILLTISGTIIFILANVLRDLFLSE